MIPLFSKQSKKPGSLQCRENTIRALSRADVRVIIDIATLGVIYKKYCHINVYLNTSYTNDISGGRTDERLEML